MAIIILNPYNSRIHTNIQWVINFIIYRTILFFFVNFESLIFYLLEFLHLHFFEKHCSGAIYKLTIFKVLSL